MAGRHGNRDGRRARGRAGRHRLAEVAIGPGNIGNLTGDTKFAYPSSGGDFDIATNGHTLTLDSGDGNAFAYSGSISGTGNVEFFMGPSYTGFRDAPLRLAGKKPNTTSGKFLVKKGRVQLEKPEGVDAISGDVIVGGQGFNDCLFWKNSHQLKDTRQHHAGRCRQQRRGLSASQRLPGDGRQSHDDDQQQGPDRLDRGRRRRLDREIADHRRSVRNRPAPTPRPRKSGSRAKAR